MFEFRKQTGKTKPDGKASIVSEHGDPEGQIPQACPQPEDVQMSGTGVLTILGYTEWYLFKPIIDVFIGNEFKGEIGRSESITLSIEKDCIVKFSYGAQTAEYSAMSDQQQTIQLKWKRADGSLKVIEL